MPVEKYCAECGVALVLRCTRDIKRKRFCSRSCLGTWHGRRNGPKTAGRKASAEEIAGRSRTRRENSIGNKRLESRGKVLYWSVMTVDGYRYEHRLVAEETLGRSLTDDEVIHHINGDGLDNRPENLMVMTALEHLQHHAKERSCRQ